MRDGRYMLSLEPVKMAARALKCGVIVTFLATLSLCLLIEF